MEKKTQENCKAVENAGKKDAIATEQNGWTFCGLPRNQEEWDWRKAVAIQEEEKQ